MISPLDVSVLDRNSEWLGIQTRTLMGNAGSGISSFISDRYPGKNVLFFLGTGNNGGDGAVAARNLIGDGTSVRIIIAGEPSRIRSRIAKDAFESIPEGTLIRIWDEETRGLMTEDLEWADLIVDGLLGSGASGRPRGAVAEAVEMINGSILPKLAIDIPTGIGTQLYVRADKTVTFHDVKEGMMTEGGPSPECGEIIIHDIGIPIEASSLVGPGDLLRIPRKEKDAHKGDGGDLLIIGGGPFTGAPILAALASSRTGCDLIRLAVPKGIWEIAASQSPNLIVERLDTSDPFVLGPEVMEDLRVSIERSDAVLIGPGGGRDQRTMDLFKEVLYHCASLKKPLVVDADAIRAVAGPLVMMPRTELPRVLLTPHRGELRALLEGAGITFDPVPISRPIMKDGNDIQLTEGAFGPISELVSTTGADILLKGSVDTIASVHRHSMGDHIRRPPIYLRYNITGVAEMSVGGTGDVLAGLCAGLMAKGMSSFDAGCLGAYISGRTGEIAFEDLGISMVATDLIDRICRVIQETSSSS